MVLSSAKIDESEIAELELDFVRTQPLLIAHDIHDISFLPSLLNGKYIES